jgi:hypothetical protein
VHVRIDETRQDDAATPVDNHRVRLEESNLVKGAGRGDAAVANEQRTVNFAAERVPFGEGADRSVEEGRSKEVDSDVTTLSS